MSEIHSSSIIYSCSVQKTAPKITKYSRNETHFENRPSWQRLQPMQNPRFRLKIKIPKNMSEIHSASIIYSCSVQKTAPKNTKYSRNETHFQNRPSWQRLQPMQNPHLGSKIKIPKNMSEIHSTNHNTVVLCKKPLQKTPNIPEMRRIFKIGHHGKGYSPCKILTLGQKLKLKKNMSELYSTSIIYSCSVQKTATKNTKYSRNETHFQNRPSWQRLQPMQNPHLGSKMKIPKNMSEIHSTSIIYSCSVQKTAPKNTKYSRNETHFQNRPFWQGYRLCKILTLSQKLKFQKTSQKSILQASFTVVLCKKTTPKNTKYSRNKTILKIGHFGKAIGFAKCSFWVKN